MKQILYYLLCCILVSSHLFSQNSNTEVTLKIAEKSGLFGMGKPRFLKISLTTKKSDNILTSDNINADSYYYFNISDVGGWVADEDFVKEELIKLKIVQDGADWNVTAVGTVVKGTDSFRLLVSCKNTLALFRPFTFVVSLPEQKDSASMEVPREWWPGYSKFLKLTQECETALSRDSLSMALSSYEQVLQDPSLKIFLDFDSLVVKRLAVFQKLMTDHVQHFQEMLSNKVLDVQTKIASTEKYISHFGFIADNAGDGRFQNQNTKKNASDIVVRSSAGVARSKFVRDSLMLALDEQTIRFIVQGSSSGRTDFKYKYIVETIVSALLSQNFKDTTATTFTIIISEQLTARLQKYELTNAFETFMRIANNRRIAKRPIFPSGFLQNLEKDTVQFSLPFHSVLKAIQSFYLKDYATTKIEIQHVMKTCYEYEITEHMDQLRMLISTIENRVPPEVQQHMKDGERAEELGDNEKATEHYRDANLIAANYAPAIFALGKIFEKSGDSYTANNYFQKAVVVDTHYYTAYRSLADNFYKNGSYKSMIDLLNQAIANDNDYFDFHYQLGLAYNGSAQFELAIQQYEYALSLNDKNINANIQAGISYQNIKSYSKAREFFNRATRIDPENTMATEYLKRLDELQK